MSNKYRDIYKTLSKEQKNKFLVWVTDRYKMKATSVKNHWITDGAVPEKYQKAVLKKLNELTE